MKRFLTLWRSFNTAHSREAVWAGVTLLFFLPLTLVLSPLLLVYVAAVLLFRVRYGIRREGVAYIGFTLLGIAIIGFVFAREFSIPSLVQASVFIGLITSLLCVGVVMMVLQGRRSIYLDLSPVMFWVLSFFYHEQLGMLLYSVGALFLALTLLLWHNMQSPLLSSLRYSAMLFFGALPIAVLLFVTFPRIHFKKADFGFHDQQAKRMGHDGQMSIGDDALLVPSRRVVMEIGFEGPIPPDEYLYFRGSVLYHDKDGLWLPAKYRRDVPIVRDGLSKSTYMSTYKVTLYPHQKQWLYALDMPMDIPKYAKADVDFVLKSDKPVMDVRHYEMRSLLSYETVPMDGYTARLSLQPPAGNPKTKALAKRIAAEASDDADAAGRLLGYFAQNRFSYTLKPLKLEGEDKMDRFLFDARKGYCVHYAAAFVTLARAAGIPARVVTGYKARRANSMENYLIVREEDAHAWSELYLNGRGWVRFDPTAQLSSMDAQSAALLGAAVGGEGAVAKEQSFSERATLYWMYTRYQIEQWVLYYSRFKQISALNAIRENMLLLFYWLGGFAVFTLFAAGAVRYFRRSRCRDASLCFMQRLWRVLARQGWHKVPHESGPAALRRMAQTHTKKETLLALADELESWRYSTHPERGLKKAQKLLGEL